MLATVPQTNRMHLDTFFIGKGSWFALYTHLALPALCVRRSHNLCDRPPLTCGLGWSTPTTHQVRHSSDRRVMGKLDAFFVRWSKPNDERGIFKATNSDYEHYERPAKACTESPAACGRNLALVLVPLPIVLRERAPETKGDA